MFLTQSRDSQDTLRDKPRKIANMMLLSTEIEFTEFMLTNTWKN